MTYAPFTGFGNDTNTAIKFDILMDGRTAPDWIGGEPKLSYHAMGNSSVEVVQRHGFTPWLMTCTLSFANPDAFEVLQTVKGTPATLRYLWGITQRAGGTKQTIGDHDYLVLPDTILVSLTISENDGVIGSVREATATFRRAYVPSPFVGFTIVGPDDD